ncbi:hypothetical protein [Jeotgalibacillus marinus]|uniref:Uncharacterized protein n=1 Tax=Jeotgalibacillus marinus TaxID=86667 RepID=A0ABV3Q7S3_9BACL
MDYENEGDFKHRGTGELNYKIGIINENDQIEWTTEKDHFSYGKDPSIIVLDDGRVLNVYGGQTSDNLWYRLGEYIDDELYWSEQINFGTAKNADIVEMDNELNRVLIVSEMNAEIHEQIGRYEDDQLVWNLPLNSDSNYGVGENPSITVLDNGLVLSTKDHKGDLLYQLGEYIDGEMYWTDPVKYDTGKKPSVLSLGDGYVVDVHEGGIGFIYYNLGRYENGEINWYSVGNHYVTHGDSYSPQIDILSNGTIVNVYHTSFFGVAYNLYYQHATFENGTLEWIDTSIASDFYDNGNYPNIAVLKDDYILETHSGENSADLWYSIGKAQDYSIDFISAEKYVSRMHRPVSLQLDNGYVLSMYTQAGNLEKYFPAYSQIATVQNEKLSWESWNGEERYTSFEGLDNDIVQLNNGLILNVHEERFNDEGRASDNIQYVLGKWSDDSKRVEWMVD